MIPNFSTFFIAEFGAVVDAWINSCIFSYENKCDVIADVMTIPTTFTSFHLLVLPICVDKLNCQMYLTLT